MELCANTTYLRRHQTQSDASGKQVERITARVLREVDFDVDAFAEAANGFIPDDFNTRAAVRNARFSWATQAKRDSTLAAVRALQSIHRAARMGSISLSDNERAIGALLIAIVDRHIANTVENEVDA